MITVIPHDKIGAGRDDDRAKIITMIYHRRKQGRIIVEGVCLLHSLAIDIESLVFNLNGFTWQTDHSFNKILRLIVGKLKHNDVASLRGLDGDNGPLEERKANAVNEFIDQDMIPDIQGGNHGPRGDFIRLHDESPNKEGQDNRDHKRLRIFAKRRFGLFLRRQLFGRC